MSPQQKLFFALCTDLNLDSEMMKERAKKKYSVEHFNDLTNKQLSELITVLNDKLHVTPPDDKHEHEFVCVHCNAKLAFKVIDQ